MSVTLTASPFPEEGAGKLTDFAAFLLPATHFHCQGREGDDRVSWPAALETHADGVLLLEVPEKAPSSPRGLAQPPVRLFTVLLTTGAPSGDAARSVSRTLERRGSSVPAALSWRRLLRVHSDIASVAENRDNILFERVAVKVVVMFDGGGDDVRGDNGDAGGDGSDDGDGGDDGGGGEGGGDDGDVGGGDGVGGDDGGDVGGDDDVGGDGDVGGEGGGDDGDA